MAFQASGSPTDTATPSAVPAADSHNSGESAPHKPAGFLAMSVGAIGVVYGDIGTSPLYAFSSAMEEALKDGASRAGVLGVVSMALWALILVVTVKYVLFLMRADNRGEGGVLSLMALAQSALGRRTTFVFMMGVIGAALFYGDAVITPAISVLSAMEGMKTVPQLHGHIHTSTIMLVSTVVLVMLFVAQARGTAKVAALFGPVMVLWFLAIGATGALHILDEPGVLMALSPHFAVEFLIRHGFVGFLVLGSVFLTVTGAEALYADMGHFGRWPIQAAWLFFALPCLALNYLGQGAFALKSVDLALANGHTMVNQDWFFLMVPAQLRIAMLILAAGATIIASQAVITGAFSLTQQAIQLGLVPRMTILRTSEKQAGQIYLPQINFLLLLGVLALVALFHTSDNLAHAYGLAVTGTMVVTTSLAFIVVRYLWKWRLWVSVAFITPFLILDTTFLAANALKILSGGWVPLLIGGTLFGVMATWVQGVRILTEKSRRDSVSLTELAEILKARAPHRVPGTAIFLTGEPDTAPVALMHNLKHNKVLHEKNVIMTVVTADTPRVDEADRLTLESINDDFKRVTLHYGFMESPNLPKALTACRRYGLKFDIMATSFFLGRRSVVPAANSGMPLWQDKLFIFLMKNAANPTEFFKIPPGRVVELGTQVTV
ncbi:MAG TPA: potassium transporter Kup [Caulobacteraceae bacterium]|nr:potassium transporter Kup [Caulobacteraceae bacterium]